MVDYLKKNLSSLHTKSLVEIGPVVPQIDRQRSLNVESSSLIISVQNCTQMLAKYDLLIGLTLDCLLAKLVLAQRWPDDVQPTKCKQLNTAILYVGHTLALRCKSNTKKCVAF